MTSAAYSQKLFKSQGILSGIIARKDAAASRLSASRERQKNVDAAQAFLQKVAQDTQSQLKYHINDLVNMALSACFPDEYDFDINFEIKRGKTEAELQFIKDGYPVDPMGASGGGCVDLAAFALRIAAWTLDQTNNTLILDEPFKWIDAERRPRAIEILKEISRRLKIQFIIVTHDEKIVDAADRVFEVRLINKVSQITVKNQ